MMKTKKILEFCGILNEDEKVESEDPNNRDLFEAELTEIGSTDYVTIDQTGVTGAR